MSPLLTNKRRRGGVCTVIYAGRPEECGVGGDAENARGAGG